MTHQKPTNREEAFQIIYSNRLPYISGIIAVALVFPLADSQELDEINNMLNRLKQSDPSFANYLEQEAKNIVDSWK